MEADAIALMTSESPDAMVLLTTQGKVVHWSKGAHSMFGYDDDEACGSLLDDLVVPAEHGTEQRARLEETLSLGTTTYEAVRRRKDDSLLYVDVSTQLVRSADGEPLILLAEKDVTHIKVLRDAKLVEARFRDLLESMPDGVVMANLTGHIVIANSQAERLFGYEDGELRGRLVDMLVPERYRHAHVGHRSTYFLQPRRRAIGSGIGLAGLRKDGTEFPVEISLSPLRTEEGAFVMSAIRDISERKRFEEALQEKNLELAATDQAKDRFLAGMSHELRTSLNAIIGFTGTLLMKLAGPLNAQQEKQLLVVQASGRHVLALINDMLDVAKIEAGKVDLKLEPVDCKAVVEEVAATLRPQAENKGLDFEVRMPEQTALWHTDRRALSQILINLASNAIKFTERGGVRMTLTQHLHDAARAMEVCIDDTGVGIASKDHGKVFGPFSRIASSHGGTPQGTGLGLHLSQKLAELLGGKIVFRSVSGEGSTFTLVLRGLAGAT